MTTENKRMTQLIGDYSDLDFSQLLNGELALPTNHNPVFKDGAGNVREILTAESAGYLENLIAEMNAGLAEIEQIIIQRIGINDEEVSLLETFSSSKITDLLADKQDSLTAGSNIQISSGNVINATDTTYTAGTNINIDSNNVINCNVLDDTQASTSTTYSSSKTEEYVRDSITQSDFTKFYGMCNKTTSISTNSSGNKVIIENNATESVISTTIISTVNGNKQIVTVVIPSAGEYKYTKTVVISKTNGITNINETYIKEEK